MSWTLVSERRILTLRCFSGPLGALALRGPSLYLDALVTADNWAYNPAYDSGNLCKDDEAGEGGLVGL